MLFFSFVTRHNENSLLTQSFGLNRFITYNEVASTVRSKGGEVTI